MGISSHVFDSKSNEKRDLKRWRGVTRLAHYCSCLYYYMLQSPSKSTSEPLFAWIPDIVITQSDQYFSQTDRFVTSDCFCSCARYEVTTTIGNIRPNPLTLSPKQTTYPYPCRVLGENPSVPTQSLTNVQHAYVTSPHQCSRLVCTYTVGKE